ncbi:MAG: glycerol-3-phosphate dehydrogenase [Desulfobulbus propionicus]|nr:MAG: glycerol-3-phosphate dehydrogenase [Desulfobulbus propionicus]
MIPKPDKIAVIGAGSWGTALAVLLGGKGKDVWLWGHDPGHMNLLAKKRCNPLDLQKVSFPDTLQVSDNLEKTLINASCIVMVVPSHAFRDVFKQVVKILKKRTLIVSATKGIEIESRMTMSQIMAEMTQDSSHFLGALSGPSFAIEVATKQPTAVTVAFADEKAARIIQQLFATDYFRTYSSTDVIGLELCGAIKNIIAIAAGISDGLGYGLNTRAALITRGLAEMSRMGLAMGADPATFAGLGGLGDLVLTCTGNLSRNRTVGLKLGSGKKLNQALAEMNNVAEGIKTTKSCYILARSLNVDMPILDQVYQVLYKDKPCTQAVSELFSRDLKKESE